MAQLLKANGDRRQTTKGSDCPAKSSWRETGGGRGEAHAQLRRLLGLLEEDVK